jgi:hypothetical protein
MADDDSDQPGIVAGGAAGEPSLVQRGGSFAYKHEINPEERGNAHRLVATGMLLTFIVVAISQDWWKHLRDWIAEKTHGPATATSPGGNDYSTTKTTGTQTG